MSNGGRGMKERGHKYVRNKQQISKEETEKLRNVFLSVDELQHYIKRSKGAIRNLVLRRAIPYRKPAGRLLFLKEEIDQWIAKAPGTTLDDFHLTSKMYEASSYQIGNR
jgi:hypothetical protein